MGFKFRYVINTAFFIWTIDMIRPQHDGVTQNQAFKIILNRQISWSLKQKWWQLQTCFVCNFCWLGAGGQVRFSNKSMCLQIAVF